MHTAFIVPTPVRRVTPMSNYVFVLAVCFGATFTPIFGPSRAARARSLFLRAVDVALPLAAVRDAGII